MSDLEQDRNSNKDDDTAVSSSFAYQESLGDKRLEIRKTQRSLRKEIPDIGVDEAIKRNNAIFEENLRFGFIREAVLDADNLQEIAKYASAKMGNPIEVSPARDTMPCLLYRRLETISIPNSHMPSILLW